jgi:hypothetical protein
MDPWLPVGSRRAGGRTGRRDWGANASRLGGEGEGEKGGENNVGSAGDKDGE